MKLTATEIKWHATECLNQLEVIEAAEEVSLSYESIVDAYFCSVLNYRACCVDFTEGCAPQSVRTHGCRFNLTYTSHVDILLVTVG